MLASHRGSLDGSGALWHIPAEISSVKWRTGKRSARPLFLTAAAVALIAAVGPGSARALRPSSIQFEAATFTANDGRAAAAEVANFKVPERHQAFAEGGSTAPAQITLRVWRFPATGVAAGPPIVLLDGGPGGAAIEATRGAYFNMVQQFRAFGDVIVADQRGTGESTPSLVCKKSAKMPPGELLTIESWLGALRSPALRCARKWRKAGVDLAAYNNTESANDIEALRLALGVEQVSLWGVSYGTQLALTFLRQFPDSAARAVLHGVLPPGGFPGLPRGRDKVLKGLARLASQAQPGLYPDLAGSLRTILADLAVNPRDVLVSDPATGGSSTVRFGDYELQYILSLVVLGNRQLMQGLPAWVAAMENGDFSAPASLGLELRRWRTTAMTMAVVCGVGENPKRARKAARQAPGSITGAQPGLSDACDPWGIDPPGADELKPVSSDVPVLLIAGTLDGTTAFADTKAAGKKLRNSHVLKLVGATHTDLVRGHPDILEVVGEFLGGGDPSRSSIPLAWSFASPAAR